MVGSDSNNRGAYRVGVNCKNPVGNDDELLFLFLKSAPRKSQVKPFSVFFFFFRSLKF